MSGPENSAVKQSGFPMSGCAVSLALAALLAAVVLLFRPTPPAAPMRLAQAGQVSIGTPTASTVPATSASTGLQFPALTGRVVDAANIIPPDVEARLNQKLTALETQSRRQLVVTTVPSLNGFEISDYGYQLGRAWGIGDKERNDGALLIVAPNERKVRIEIGYGLEGILTDGLSSLIIQSAIVPKFKAGDMAGGIEAGADAMIAHLSLPDAEARKVAAEVQPALNTGGGISIGTLVFTLFIIFFIILPLLRAARGGRRYSSGAGPVIIWGGSSGGFGGGGGGFGGGGFSGGGGSFGGGGSSGSW